MLTFQTFACPYKEEESDFVVKKMSSSRRCNYNATLTFCTHNLGGKKWLQHIIFLGGENCMEAEVIKKFATFCAKSARGLKFFSPFLWRAIWEYMWATLSYIFFFFFDEIFSNTLGGGGNSFCLCMYTHSHATIHAFLLFDGLNLERVFDKRVKIAVYVVACVQHSCCWRTNKKFMCKKREKEMKSEKFLSLGIVFSNKWFSSITHTHSRVCCRMNVLSHTSECERRAAAAHDTLVRKIVSKLFEKKCFAC